ncbi:MAG: bifunctional diaminohydroxyphosphoribosylaminopyrimidine deaminase/5-amino-6-(5-phosphoribosylamino)uracil reductase RibD [Ignavibacteria bacterium]
MDKNRLMNLTLSLAQKGGIKTFPNPNVGAIIVKDGKIIGEGYHRFFGDSHAEINALNEAGEDAKDATMFVTLEPCSHYGKTPPCVDAIIKAGIKKVYIGMKDPNPLVSGNGIKKLREAKIEVEVGILQSKIKKFYEDYSKRFQKKNSYVVLKYAMTLDGKIATSTGDSKWISSDKSREWVHKFRTNFDGILVGVKTIIKDNPELSSHGKGKNPVRVILDPDLEIPLNSRVIQDEFATVIIYSNKDKKQKIEQIQKHKKYLLYINSKKGLIDFKKIIEELKRISIYSVLIEGGGLTAWTALSSGVVDEIVSFVSPKIIGGVKAISPVEGEGINKISRAIRTKIIHFEKSGEDILIKSKIIKN